MSSPEPEQPPPPVSVSEPINSVSRTVTNPSNEVTCNEKPSDNSSDNNDVDEILSRSSIESDHDESDQDLVRNYTHSVADMGPNQASEAQEMERVSRSLTNTQSLAEIARKSTAPLPPMGGGRPYPPALPDKEQYVVSFEADNDSMHPFNWPFKKKLGIFFCLTICVMIIAFGSSVFSTGIPEVSKEFHVSTEVGTLGVSLYVLGFATGPIVWAPLSELYGRKIVLIISVFVFTCFQFAVATAKDIQTIMLSRFFGSCIGSAPLVVVGAAFSDMFDNRTRGYAISFFSLGVVLGPQLAPIVGGFISSSYLGWRWTEYITGILGAVSLVLIVLVYEESHHPIILVRKAEDLRRRTGNWGIRAAHEEFSLSFREIAEKNISRPLVLLFTEPILFLITIYVSFVYGILYLCLTAFPLVFEYGYGWKGGIVYLPYIGMCVGQMLGCLWVIYCEKEYKRQVDLAGGKPVPEARLPALAPGGVIFPIGLLWLCWTGNYYDKVPWPAPACSGIFIGFGIMSIFLPSINFIIDCYLIYAASAMAANSFIRSIFGAVFPLFGTYMFTGMGTNWAGLLLGLFAFCMTPVPFLFMKYGRKIRARSKYAFNS
ncbi:Tpo1 protein [Saccharomycopsis crataegensis]|uniref:Tpo1 protein n=1 Tax=Saccharomycopsis crataegensis TaxID=43959 RepID=A0AAV5QSE5_9ASCO|nr:Tpo1 protein [Saccharomycopsis crataegensis]